MVAQVEVELSRTPLYRFAYLEVEVELLDAEAMSAIFDATSLLPTGIAFDIVVDMIG